jgi:uncharacterized protein
MDLMEKNGQPSMEEILASIRRIIAEEPQGANPVIDLNARSAASRTDLDLEEGSDFELPSMFRPSTQPAAEKHTPLFGRLTDAIRGASATASIDPRAGRYSDAAPPAPETAFTNGHASDETQRTHPSLSSLKLSRIEPIATDRDVAAAAVRTYQASGQPSDKSFGQMPVMNGSAIHAHHDELMNGHTALEAMKPSSDTQPPRQMAAFKDTRFSMMTPVVSDPPVSPPELTHNISLLRPTDLGAIVPGQYEPMHVVHQQHTPTHASEPFVTVHPYTSPETPYIPVVEYAPVQAAQDALPLVYPHITDMPFTTASPPAVPTAKPESFATGTIDDTTADLLRPMLRQWLADNMPRMVEKALHIEVAESVKTGKKFNGH